MFPRRASSYAYLSIACLAAGCAGPKVDVRAKRESLKLALEKTSTQEDFIRIAQANGMDCNVSTPGEVDCIWHEPQSKRGFAGLRHAMRGNVGKGQRQRKVCRRTQAGRL
jgi:hypothetical protein